MKYRAALSLAALAGLAAAAHAQELIRVTYSWQEVLTGTTVVVTNPNSICDPGESARISLNIQALINGTNAVGQTTTYTPPPPPGAGTVRGISSMVYNLRATNVQGGGNPAFGTWGPRTISNVLSAGAFTGTVMNNGALLDSFGGGQFVAPGGTAISTNPINNAFRGVWTPSSFNADVRFFVEPGTAVPTGQQNGMLVAFGTTQVDPSDPSTWYENYLSKYVATDYGNGLYIPIIPAPTGAAVLGVGAVVALRRRRVGSVRP